MAKKVGEEWENILGATSITYSPSTNEVGLTKYRLLVSSYGKGGVESDYAISNEFSLVVGEYDAPIVRITCNKTIEEIAGYDVEPSVEVSNKGYFKDGVQYQWQYLNTQGLYLKLSEGASFQGYTFTKTNEAKMKISRATPTSDVLVIRCQITGIISGYKRIANSEDINVKFISLPLPVITVHPIGGTFKTADNDHYLTVSAPVMHEDIEQQYQWQAMDSEGEWYDLSGATSFNYAVSRRNVMAKTQFRCVVSNAAGTVWSNSAAVEVVSGTAIELKLDTGLSLEYYDGIIGYHIDNEQRKATCYVGTTFKVGFNYSFNTPEAESEVNKDIWTDYRNVTGIGTVQTSPYDYTRIFEADMVGTFELYGEVSVTYGGQYMHIDYTNSDEMKYTIEVLPNKIMPDYEQDPVFIKLGDEPEHIFAKPLESLLTNGGLSTNSTANFRGNHQASSYYHFVSGYELYMGIPDENGEINYVMVAENDLYANDTYNNGDNELILDTRPEKLAELGIETLDGVYDSYIVLNYQQIVIEDDGDGNFIVSHKKFEGPHFTITVNGPCDHELVTPEYEFGSDAAGLYIKYSEKCDICGDYAKYDVIHVDSDEALPVLETPSTCTTDGLKPHKEFHGGEYDKYYVKDENTGKYVETTYDSLIVKAHHGEMIHYDGVEPTNKSNGSIEHYECKECGACFILEDENYIEIENVIIPAVFDEEVEESETGTVYTVTFAESVEKIDVNEIFEKASKNSGIVKLVFGDTTITFNQKAVNEIAEGKPVISFNKAKEDRKVVFNITLEGATFESGLATIESTFDESLKKNEFPSVYFVNGEEKTKMDAHFSDGKVTFSTNHFSRYEVVVEKGRAIGAGGIVGIVLGSVVVLGLAGFSVYWFVIKKKKFADLKAIFKKDKAAK